MGWASPAGAGAVFELPYAYKNAVEFPPQKRGLGAEIKKCRTLQREYGNEH